MLEFFRKYQKIFFVLVTVIIVISFSVAGINTQAVESIPDKRIGKTVNGRPIYSRELLALSQLLSHSVFDTDRSSWPHLLNDGVIEKNFLETGLAVMLAEQYFFYLEPELARKEQIITCFKPYAHPYHPQLNCQAIWKSYSPILLEHLEQLKKNAKIDVSAFSTMCQLYLDQVAFPKEAMQQILHFQEQRLGFQKDLGLAKIDFSLFGFKNVKDWFGSRFIQLASQFILNVSALAEQKKYQITKQEAQADLLQNIYKGYQQLSQKDALNVQQIMQYFQQELQVLGLRELDVVNAWRHVMLFRRLVSDTAGSVFNDPLAQKQFHVFADQSVEVELYELPPCLRLNDFLSMLKLQVYLEAVALEKPKNLTLQLEIASLDSIEEKQPALVQRKIETRLSSVKIEELAAQISLKSTWAWEVTDEGWSFVQRAFPEVKDSVDRRQALDQLGPSILSSIDQAVRLEMVRRDRDLITRALQQRPMQAVALSVRKKQLAQGPYNSLLSNQEFIAFLEDAPLGSIEERCVADTYYRVELVAREEQKELVSFEEASQDGTLDFILDQQLEEAYPSVRKGRGTLFLQVNGNFKPFSEVKEQIARIVYEPLLLAIEQEYIKTFNELPGVSKELPSSFYCNYRLYGFMQDWKQQLEKGNEINLPKQWELISTLSRISRNQKLNFPTDNWMEIPSGQWSAVSVGSSGSLAFAKVCSKENSEGLPLEKIEQGFEFLSLDTCRDVMRHLLQKIVEGNCIVFSDSTKDAL